MYIVDVGRKFSNFVNIRTSSYLADVGDQYSSDTFTDDERFAKDR
jgi:hypothetical protein